MKNSELYRLANGPSGGFIITKYDHIGFEVLSNYHMADAITCECPAGHRDTCRHRQMLPAMLDIIDTDVFYRHGDGKHFQFVDGRMMAVNVQKAVTIEDLVRPEAPAEGTEYSSLPEGVTILGLDNMTQLHDTIADAVGESSFRRRF